jgi:ABC-type cobalamin/Fe3+-siderophores transport system ATPase subunit
LGRLNVLCGRNNSGKSTVLEALNNPAHRTVGSVLSKNQGSEILSAVMDATNAHARGGHYKQKIEAASIEVIASQGLWYIADLQNLEHALRQTLMAQAGLPSTSWSAQRVVETLRDAERTSKIDTSSCKKASGA